MTAQRLKQVVVHEGAGEDHGAGSMAVVKVERTANDLIEDGGDLGRCSGARQHSKGGGELGPGGAGQVIPPTAGVIEGAADGGLQVQGAGMPTLLVARASELLRQVNRRLQGQ